MCSGCCRPSAAGEVAAQTDPLGLVTAYTFDPLGRTLKTVADYTGTFNADGTPAGARTSNAANQTTAYTYDGDNNVTSMTAVMPTGQHSQTTDYVYGVTTAGGSGVNDADLLATTEYPSPTTGAASSSQAETTAYDALGEATGYTDRNGTTHAYTYDAFGRLTSDAVTQFGTGVDQAVKMLGYTYTDDGLLASATSYSSTAGGTANIVNQDVDAYDGFGQLASEEQAVTGAASVSSPTVGYTYDAANGDRLTGIVYPNGRTLTYNYNANALTSAASQITSLSDSSGAIQSYTYLGLATPVTFADGNGITLSYLAGDGSVSDGGDQYTGLDEFGRVVDQDWVNSSGTAVDEQQYTYDADSNVLSDNNTVLPSQSELYTYDDLNRLTTFARGTLNDTDTAIQGTPTGTESWSLDAVGNWQSNTLNGTTTTRTNNAQNQVTSVGSATLSYDADGNTLADNTGQQYVYDAWNRLVTVKNASGTTIAGYTYDAQGRRVTEADPGQLTTALYYSKDWQVLETDVGGVAAQQYTWSPFYVDGLVARDDHTPGESSTALDRRLYPEQDADYNVTSLTNASGAVVERYAYDPYGAVTVENADGTMRGTGSASASLYGSVYLHQGLQLDMATGTYDDENRVYLVSLGRLAQEDRAGYIDGANVYQFVLSSPVVLVDPSGCAGQSTTAPSLPGLFNPTPPSGPTDPTAQSYEPGPNGTEGNGTKPITPPTTQPSRPFPTTQPSPPPTPGTQVDPPVNNHPDRRVDPTVTPTQPPAGSGIVTPPVGAVDPHNPAYTGPAGKDPNPPDNSTPPGDNRPQPSQQQPINSGLPSAAVSSGYIPPRRVGNGQRVQNGPR